MIIGILKEEAPEQRVAMLPEVVSILNKNVCECSC